MEKINTVEQWMEITPGRFRKNPKTLNQHWTEFKKNIVQVRHLIRGNMRRRTFGFALGNLWFVIEPILLAFFYWFIFNFIFRLIGDDSRFLYIFTSLTFWLFHAHLLNGSPNLMASRGGVLKQTNFPLQLIVYDFVGTDLALFVFKPVVLLVFLLASGIVPNATLLFLPFIFITQLVFTLSLVMIFASLGQFFKDISRVLSLVTRIWWYMSPGIYGVSRVPEEFLSYYKFNPFAHILPAYHNVLLYGKAPEIGPLVVIFIVSLLILIPGSILFSRSRYYFFNYS